MATVRHEGWQGAGTVTLKAAPWRESKNDDGRKGKRLRSAGLSEANPSRTPLRGARGV